MRALLIGLAVIITAYLTLHTYQWKRHTDVRTYYADLSGAYLFGPSGVQDAAGKAVSRQQLLDTYLHAQIEAHPEWGLTFTK